MTQIKFSRAGKRRFNKHVASFVSLLGRDEKLFRREWHKQVQGWLNEAHRRAGNWLEGARFRNAATADGLVAEGRARIFGVLDIAEVMLAACGAHVEELVGEETRRLLTAECTKAVANVCDSWLHYMVN